MQTIIINGREYSMQFNMLTAVTFQRLTGKDPFSSVHEVTDLVEMGYSMALANNEDVPPFTDFVASIDTLDAMKAFIDAVNNEAARFFRLEKGDDTGTDTGEDEKKN